MHVIKILIILDIPFYNLNTYFSMVQVNIIYYNFAVAHRTGELYDIIFHFNLEMKYMVIMRIKADLTDFNGLDKYYQRHSSK